MWRNTSDNLHGDSEGCEEKQCESSFTFGWPCRASAYQGSPFEQHLRHNNTTKTSKTRPTNTTAIIQNPLNILSTLQSDLQGPILLRHSSDSVTVVSKSNTWYSRSLPDFSFRLSLLHLRMKTAVISSDKHEPSVEGSASSNRFRPMPMMTVSDSPFGQRIQDW